MAQLSIENQQPLSGEDAKSLEKRPTGQQSDAKSPEKYPSVHRKQSWCWDPAEDQRVPQLAQ